MAQFVGEVGLATFKSKEVVGAAVHVFTRRGGKADHQGVEIVQDGNVLAEYATVSFVDDDQVKTTDREAFVFLVNVVDHRLVGREDDTGVEVRFLALVENGARVVWQVLLEVLVGLVDQRGAVSKKEDVLDPAVAGENVHQRDGYTGLAGTGSHHQKATAMHLVEVVADAVDGHLLVVTIGNIIVGSEVRNVATTAVIDDYTQVFFCVEGIERPCRITKAIDDEGLKTISVVDDRANAILGLQAICVEFRLVLAYGRVFHRALSLNDCKRLSVCTEENVVHIANTMLVGHTGHLHLDAGLAGHNLSFHVQHVPSSIFEHQVDEQATGFCFSVVIAELYGLYRSKVRLSNGSTESRRDQRLDFCSRSNVERNGIRKERFVKLCERLQDTQFQEDAANEVIEVENAEECFFAGGLSIVYAQVAHLADIVRCHHHPVIGDELDEGCPCHQLIQACPLR